MESRNFLEHYVAYLTSWKGFLAVVFVGVLAYGIWRERKRRLTQERRQRRDVVRGCFRYGIYGKSELENQYCDSVRASQTPEKQRTSVKAIFVYPIKSCRGVELQRAGVTSTGLVCDRVFSFAQLVSTDTSHQWRFITQREFPKLALLNTELWLPNPDQDDNQVDRIQSWAANGGCLVVKFPYPTDSRFGQISETVTIKLPLNPTFERSIAKQYEEENITVWTECPLAINITNEIDAPTLAKLKYFLGVSNPLGLFKQNDDELRKITRSLPGESEGEDYRVGFPDAFPVSILNLASIRDIDALLPSDNVAKGNLDARRFRANIYVSGPEAYAEDRWKQVAIGKTASEDGRRSSSAIYHAACRTARCNLPNVDPATGIKDRNEPGTTLRRTRQVDEGAKPHPCLGLSMIPLFDRGVFKVGDEVKVLETGEHFYEKMFPQI
ncbi:Putative molybdenum cofactor sulfurase, pyruvate kinase-like, insert domain superfamily [Septoria linicola]|uniref:Molybdenum cofactor sulfurase, pyruvate kinase-like, insert domain superfamily n=1 Tax=Septoria linicola TaxID=215465 RepID=A0A9Q9B1B4_9PEZI|nr:putative molybdenum cofactor sulfurase, pyruvate kinase-like, insert domain superfamily [Septoria linicola]USW54521.1 Putative molybdenum cofactor sulfurase, pyruvate kinase-like, insert domain superfamily [Septoria linicola]